MAFSTSSKFPNPAFNFSTNLWGKQVKFQEVTGLKAEMGFKEVRSGGVNNQVFKIPTVASYGDVTLKKGVFHQGDEKNSSSDLFTHLKKAVHFNSPYSLINKSIGDLRINLFNEEAKIVASWSLVNPSLLSWEIGTLNAQNNELAFETLVFSCSEIKHLLY